jgi:hypothetical protein
MAITPSPKALDIQWLHQWFLGFDLLSLVSGSSVPQLNKQDLAPLRIALPPLELQNQFAAVVQNARATSVRPETTRWDSSTPSSPPFSIVPFGGSCDHAVRLS